MPVQRCQHNGKPGYRWGKSGKCYTYQPGNRSAETAARNRAQDQGIAIGEAYGWMVDRLQRIRARLSFSALNLEFKDKADKATYMQERWIAQNDKDTCPVCLFLAGLEWVQLGALPEYERAHSQLGGPNWKSGDGSCRCYKDYRRGTDGTVRSFEETKRLWYVTYQNLSAQQKSQTFCKCGSHDGPKPV
jgi:hypothetical protein